MKEEIDRFWEKVEKTGSCWNWLGYKMKSGYGTFGSTWPAGVPKRRDTPGKKTRYAHRFSYELHVGPIECRLTIDHLCKNRGCVNPKHLELISQGGNTLRGDGPAAKNKRMKKCARGHEFTYTNEHGRRICNPCHNMREKMRYSRLRRLQKRRPHQ